MEKSLDEATPPAGLADGDLMLRRFLAQSPYPMGVVQVTPDRADIRHLYDNGATGAFFGVPPGRLAGRLAQAELRARAETVALWIGHYLESARRRGPVSFTYWEHGGLHGGAWLDVTVYPLDEAIGPDTRYGYVCKDISVRRAAQEALRQREAELQSLADNSPDVIARFDPALRHVFVNAAAERVTGIRARDFIGRTNEELGLPPALCRDWNEALRHVFDAGEPAALDFTFGTGTEARHFAARYLPERDAQGVVRSVLAVVHDRSGEARAQALLRHADRQKDEFIALLAHELRNPLAPLRAGLEILRRAPCDGEAAATARAMMERQLALMVRLVDDLLDTSRISHGHLALQLQPVVLRQALDDALDTVRPLLQQRGHELVLALPAQPLRLRADPARLAQVLGNLLGNAAKYTPPRGRIEVRARREGDWAHVEVQDDGQGIEAQALPQIFDMFSRGRPAPALHGDAGGLGIGLALVRQLVQLHGGEVTAHSDGPGRGSVFTLRLPLAEDDTAPGAAVAPAGAAAAALTVAVVDDNADAAESLALLLELSGHRVLTAHDGPSALALLQRERPDLLLLDLGLPGMSGLEIAPRVRADPALAGTLLVALTGWGAAEDRRRSREAGFDEHLTKPVAPAEIERVLGVAARRRCEAR